MAPPDSASDTLNESRPRMDSQGLERERSFAVAEEGIETLTLEERIAERYQNNALFVLGPENPLRKAVIRVIEARWFEWLSLMVILLNTAALAAQDPLQAPDSDRNSVLEKAELGFQIYYSIELVLKVCAMGLIFHPYSYLRDAWNCFDFFIVAVGWVTFFFTSGSSGASALRAFRVLRAIRTIRGLKGIRIIVNSLLSSIPYLGDVVALWAFMFVLFGIAGVQMWRGDLRNRCFIAGTNQLAEPTDRVCTENPPHGRLCPTGQECRDSGSSPNDDVTHFDNIGNAMLTLFQVLTLEGWVDIMYFLQDAATFWVFLYFVTLVIFGSFFVVNLAIAVLYAKFSQVTKESERLRAQRLEAEKAKKEMDRRISELSRVLTLPAGGAGSKMQLKANEKTLAAENSARKRRNTTFGDHILAASVAFEADNDSREDGSQPGSDTKPKGTGCWSRFRASLHAMVETTIFQKVIVALILLNTLVLTTEHHNMHPTWRATNDMANLVFTILFALEFLVKLLALGFRGYFSDKFNIFDAVVVLFSLVEYALFQGGWVVIFRALRLLRVFKLARTWDSLRNLLEITLESMGLLSNCALLMLLFLVIYAVIGMQLFGGKFTFPHNLPDEPVVPRSNFDTFFWSLVVVFQIMTGENWNEVMYDGMTATHGVACLYFVTLVLVGSYIILNLFQVILLQKFSASSELAATKEQDRRAEALESSTKEEALTRSRRLEAHERRRQIHRGVNLQNLKAMQANFADKEGERVRFQLDGSYESYYASYSDEDEHRQGRDGYDDGDTYYSDHDDGGYELAVIPSGGGRDRLAGSIDIEECAASAAYNLPIVSSEYDDDESSSGVFLDDGGGRRESRRRDADDGGHSVSETYSSEIELRAMRRRRRELGLESSDVEESVLHERDGERGPSTHELEQRGFTKTKSGKVTIGSHIPQTPSYASSGSLRPIASVSAQELAELDTSDQWPPILHGRLFWIFGPNNPIRVVLSRIVLHRYFETFIIAMILCSAIMLAIEHPGLDPESTLGKVIKISDYVFVALFGFEALAKILVLGLLFHKGAYFRSPWNVLDFIVVVVSILNLFIADLRWLRAMRALRPLRLISRSTGMRVVVYSLTKSLPSIMNVLLVCVLFWVVFGVLGVQFYAGKFYYCNDPAPWIDTRAQCNGTYIETTSVAGLAVNQTVPRRWINRRRNFDHIGKAMVTLFEVATLEEWPQIMHLGVDAVDIDKSPKRDHNPFHALYFIIFIIVAAFFVVNLFVGVVIDNFNAMKSKQNGSALLTRRQADWVEVQKVMVRYRPNVIPDPPRRYWPTFRTYVFRFIRDKRFEYAIVALICINIGFMAATHHNQDESITFMLEIVNWVFTIIFTIEAILKLIGLGIPQYFREPWNVFDMLVVVVSIVGLIYSVGVGATLFRGLRVVRIFKILRAAKGINSLLYTLFYSLPTLSNVGSLLLLIFFIYAVAGVALFGRVKEGDYINHHANFKHFGNAMLVLFRMVTGESWNGIMHDASVRPPDCELSADECGTVFAWVYFLSFMILVFFVFMNMVIAVILESFGNLTSEGDEFPLNEKHFRHFSKLWTQHDPKSTYYIPAHKIQVFVNQLEPPLGVGTGATRLDVIRSVMALDVPVIQGKVFYRDLLIALAHRRMGVALPPVPVVRTLYGQWPRHHKSIRGVAETGNHFPVSVHEAALTVQRHWRQFVANKRAARHAAAVARLSRGAEEPPPLHAMPSMGNNIGALQDDDSYYASESSAGAFWNPMSWLPRSPRKRNTASSRAAAVLPSSYGSDYSSEVLSEIESYSEYHTDDSYR